MKIKHKLTGDELTISRIKWDDEYLPKKLDSVYEIIEEDTVLLREILENGDRRPFKKFDRDHALRMIKDKPNRFDFIEVHEELTEEEKIAIILDILDKEYPGYVYVKDFAAKKFKSSIREGQILMDRLIEENLAKSLGNPDHRMQITPNGINLNSNGGYLKSKQKEKAKYEDCNYNPEDKFAETEKKSVNDKLDELARKLERLETGQHLIYDDILSEIEELKSLTGILGKKTWTQTLKGKLVDWGFGELTEKGFDLLAQTFKDDRLLNG